MSGLTGVHLPWNGPGGGAWIGNNTEHVTATSMNKVRNDLNMMASGTFGRSHSVGGSLTRGLVTAAATDVLDALDFEIDNTSSYVSGTSGITISVTVWVRVENAGISVTPRIYNVTDAGVATTSGSAACSATTADFTGTDSKQTLLLTLAAGVKKYRLQITPSAATYQVFAAGWLNIFV